MTAATESYTIGLAGLATVALSSANQTTEKALISSEQGITLSVMTVRQDSNLTGTHAEGYPCCHVYVVPGTDIECEEYQGLNRRQDWIVPVTVSILYHAMDASEADTYAIWYGQLAKMCVEKHWRGMTHTVGSTSVAIPVWSVQCLSAATSPQMIDESRYLYRTDLEFDMRYRCARGA